MGVHSNAMLKSLMRVSLGWFFVGVLFVSPAYSVQESIEGTIKAHELEFGYIEYKPERGAGARADAPERPVVLLFHGYPERAGSWGEVQRALSAAGYHSYAIHMRGYPPTTAPADGDYSPIALQGDVLALIDALGDGRAVLVGHDWGATAVYNAAAHAPEKVPALVTLAIPAPNALAGDPTLLLSAPHFLYYQFPWAEWMVARNDFAHIDGIYESWAAPGYVLPVDDMKDLKATLAQEGVVGQVLGYYWAIFSSEEDQKGAATAQTIFPMPSLLMAGELDGAVGADRFEVSKEAFSGAYQLHVVKGAGHFPQLEKPEDVSSQLVEFLNRYVMVAK